MTQPVSAEVARKRRVPRATIGAAAVKLVEALRRARATDGARAAEVLACALERDGDPASAAAVRAAITGEGGAVAQMVLLRRTSVGEWSPPQAVLEDLVLDEPQEREFARLVSHLEATSRLLAAGIDAPTRVLFSGPSGTGKTLAARHLAQRLGVPLLLGRLDVLVSSHMGDTAKKLAEMFAEASTCPSVLFLDEIDGLVGQRGCHDSAAATEIGRATSSLLQQLDLLPAAQVVVVASNFPGDMDAALLRRFPSQLTFVPPNREARARMVAGWWRALPMLAAQHLDAMVQQTEGLSGAELRARAMDAARRALLGDCA